ncbi:hypothetical protein GH733_010947 [Mirounga leonina]|nr:hypothetical protein GH733_010947 [Mirounga leonina]
MYDLVARVVHCGSGPNRGHYITIVKSHGFRLLFDDNIVEKIDAQAIEEFYGLTSVNALNAFRDRISMHAFNLSLEAPLPNFSCSASFLTKGQKKWVTDDPLFFHISDRIQFLLCIDEKLEIWRVKTNVQWEIRALFDTPNFSHIFVAGLRGDENKLPNRPVCSIAGPTRQMFTCDDFYAKPNGFGVQAAGVRPGGWQIEPHLNDSRVFPNTLIMKKINEIHSLRAAEGDRILSCMVHKEAIGRALSSMSSIILNREEGTDIAAVELGTHEYPTSVKYQKANRSDILQVFSDCPPVTSDSCKMGLEKIITMANPLYRGN